MTMAESTRQAPSLLPPIVAFAYNCARMVKDMVECLEGIESSVTFGHPQEHSFFVLMTSSNKKRKTLLP